MVKLLGKHQLNFPIPYLQLASHSFICAPSNYTYKDWTVCTIVNTGIVLMN